MPKSFRYLSFIFLFFFLGLTGCAKEVVTNQSQIEQKLKIYATIYPVYDFTKKIGGDLVEVNQIVPRDADAHSFEPSAKLLTNLAHADLVIYNGANMEPWIPKVMKALEKEQVTFINASENVTLLKLGEDSSQHGFETAHEHYGVDPHIWLSPKNAVSQSRTICNALIAIDEEHAGYYRHNFTQLVKELEKLDREYRLTLQNSRRKEFIVAHDAFGYLAKEYGLKQIPIRGLTAEVEPSPTKIREIITLARKYGLKYVFFESQTVPKISEAIAQELGIQTLELNPLGNLTAAEIMAGEDYFSIMRTNLANLKTALNEE
jgi:zinc transport system substrate-binding protein